MHTALYPGSFDPVHLGHMGIIEQAATAFDGVVVGVLGNPDKPHGLFPLLERVALLAAATQFLENVTVVHFDGLTVDLARELGVSALIRTMHKEQDNELSMAAMNQQLTGIDTVFMPASSDSMTLSSSAVREMVRHGQIEAAARLVPACVRSALLDGRFALDG